VIARPLLVWALFLAPSVLSAQAGRASSDAAASAEHASSSSEADDARAPVTLVVHGPSAPRVRDAARRTRLPIALRVVDPPRATSAPSDDGEAATFARARSAYVDADFEACLEALGAPTRVDDALGLRRRSVAARLAFWRAACAFAAGDETTASRVVERMATMRLPIPSDVELASPTFERLLADVYASVAARAPVEARLDATSSGAVLVDDLDRCATPCTLTLPPGEHVVRFEGPGSTPVHLTTRFPSEPLRLDPSPASPSLAAEQWAARIASGGDPEDAISLRLLARAIRARNLVLLTAEVPELRAALVVDGRRITRAAREGAREGELEAAVEPLLRELLVEGSVLEPPPPLWRRPGLWVGVVLTAAVVATVTALLVREPTTRTEVGF
jgi:hypothetical protein